MATLGVLLGASSLAFTAPSSAHVHGSDDFLDRVEDADAPVDDGRGGAQITGVLVAGLSETDIIRDLDGDLQRELAEPLRMPLEGESMTAYVQAGPDHLVSLVTGGDLGPLHLHVVPLDGGARSTVAIVRADAKSFVQVWPNHAGPYVVLQFRDAFERIDVRSGQVAGMIEYEPLDGEIATFGSMVSPDGRGVIVAEPHPGHGDGSRVVLRGWNGGNRVLLNAPGRKLRLMLRSADGTTLLVREWIDAEDSWSSDELKFHLVDLLSGEWFEVPHHAGLSRAADPGHLFRPDFHWTASPRLRWAMDHPTGITELLTGREVQLWQPIERDPQTGRPATLEDEIRQDSRRILAMWDDGTVFFTDDTDLDRVDEIYRREPSGRIREVLDDLPRYEVSSWSIDQSVDIERSESSFMDLAFDQDIAIGFGVVDDDDRGTYVVDLAAESWQLVYPNDVGAYFRYRQDPDQPEMRIRRIQRPLVVGADGRPVRIVDGRVQPVETSAPDDTRLVAVTASPGGGIWAVDGLGRMFVSGDALHVGDLDGLALVEPINAMTPTTTSNGYWMAASDGGVFAFGDASFHGSMGGVPLNEPVVGMAVHPSGRGYWLVASDGGVFAFGNAPFHGSLGGIDLVRPISAIAPTPSGAGYWMVADDGGVFAFGDAGFHGSLGGTVLDSPVVGMSASDSGAGYWLVTADGVAHPFGDARSA